MQTEPIDIVALAYDLSDVDFLTMSSPPEGAAASPASLDISSLFTTDESFSVQKDSCDFGKQSNRPSQINHNKSDAVPVTTIRSSPPSRNEKCGTSNISSSLNSNRLISLSQNNTASPRRDRISSEDCPSSEDVFTIDLTSPTATAVENEFLSTQISPTISSTSTRTDSTSVSPSQVSGSCLPSPESLNSESSCADDVSNVSSLLLQGNKGNDSIIEFLLSEDSQQSNVSSTLPMQKQLMQPEIRDVGHQFTRRHLEEKNPVPARKSPESNKRKQLESDPEETQMSHQQGHPRKAQPQVLPELDIDYYSTIKLDTFFDNIPDIQQEYLGRLPEKPSLFPYMCETDWKELIAKCPPYSATFCRSSWSSENSSCEPPATKRHCSPPHRQLAPMPPGVQVQLSPPQRVTGQSSVKYAQFSHTKSAPSSNSFSTVKSQSGQSFQTSAQFSKSEYQAATRLHSANIAKSSQNIQSSLQATSTSSHHQQPAFTTTQKLSVLSGITFHGPSSTLSTTAQERAEKLKGKPSDTYIALIARAILSSPTLTTSLPDIYEQIMLQQPFYRTSTLAWRNAVRHNLSINECFVKVGKADSGRGWKWTIHPSCVEQFRSGDFRRREARSRVQQMHKTTNNTTYISSLQKY